jgi:hypothetical protein
MPSVLQVLPDSSHDQHRFLTHITDAFPKGVQIEVTERSRVKGDVSALGVVESFDHLDDGTLARARGADDSSGLLGFEGERNTLEDIWGALRHHRIPEEDIFEMDSLIQFYLGDSSILTLDQGGSQ